MAEQVNCWHLHVVLRLEIVRDDPHGKDAAIDSLLGIDEHENRAVNQQ
jgi:hypothetical protein